MNLFIANDHAGLHLKQVLMDYLANLGYSVTNIGTDLDQSVDYPDYANKLVDQIKFSDDMGILICGSGIGMSVAANRFKFIRAALCYSKDHAKFARSHNNANVLVLGARFVDDGMAKEIVKVFLGTEFEGGRHLARINKLS